MCDATNDSDFFRDKAVTERLDEIGARMGLLREPDETDRHFAEKLLGHVDAIIRRLKDLREELDELETLYLG